MIYRRCCNRTNFFFSEKFGPSFCVHDYRQQENTCVRQLATSNMPMHYVYYNHT